MSFVMAAHALTGAAVVCSGAMALLLSKGSSKHKLAGRVFVGLMLLMGPVVAAGALFAPGSISSLGILFVFLIIYLVVSACSTIRRPERLLAPLDIAAPMVVLCISVAGLIMGFDAVSIPSDGENPPPQEACFFFAALAFIAMLLDINNLRQGGVRGKHRIVRHVANELRVVFCNLDPLYWPRIHRFSRIGTWKFCLVDSAISSCDPCSLLDLSVAVFKTANFPKRDSCRPSFAQFH